MAALARECADRAGDGCSKPPCSSCSVSSEYSPSTGHSTMQQAPKARCSHRRPPSLGSGSTGSAECVAHVGSGPWCHLLQGTNSLLEGAALCSRAGGFEKVGVLLFQPRSAPRCPIYRVLTCHGPWSKPPCVTPHFICLFSSST
jgi:hypothetical protein